MRFPPRQLSFFFTHTAPTEIYTLSLHDALPISAPPPREQAPNHPSSGRRRHRPWSSRRRGFRSEEHTSELQSLRHLVCRLLLEKKKKLKRSISKCCIVERPEIDTCIAVSC